jgi:predicted HTH domain antitoxin
MNTFNIELPTTLNINEFEVKMILACKLFEDGKLSSGQAAEIVGLSKRDFLDLLENYNVNFFGYDFEELIDDIENE